jgi:23S rRNA (guanine2445-N2)-methyltransferase / 23S rRNA (guanine2069-N7)-methyltransferase
LQAYKLAINLVATSAFGLEAVVIRDLVALGYGEPKPRAEAGRIRFVADELAIARCNLWLRSADRLLVEIGHWEASDFDALFDGVEALPWEQWLPANAGIHVVGKSVRSQLSSVPAVQRCVKKAIVNRLCEHYAVPALPEDGTTFRIQVSLLNNEASLLIDTSGHGLHKRGYGAEVGEAPLKETMAAGLVQLSFWRPNRTFLDPFCGSGTIAIEAAMIGRNQAPGLERDYAAENWLTLDSDIWRQARAEARDLLKTGLMMDIRGSDIDSSVAEMAARRAFAAGVDDTIRFEACDVFSLPELPEYGCLITNPPYGERMGDHWAVVDLHRDLPRAFAAMPTWSLYVITGVEKAEVLFGRKADRRRKLYNGRLACTYYQFWGPRPARDKTAPEASVPESPVPEASVPESPVPEASLPESPVADAPPPAAFVAPPERLPPIVVAFGALPEKAEEQAAQFAVRLQKRARHYRRWPSKQGIACYRLYNQDVPGVALVIDRYDDRWHFTDYTHPSKYPADTHQAWLNLMRKTFTETLELDAGSVYVKQRRRQVGNTQHERQGNSKHTFVVEESGLRFEVNLSDYVDTGLFLDHRQTRQVVQKAAAGKDLLNLFCYTGSFSVYAAAGGARSTCSVDLSNTYLEWTRRNLALNGFDSSANKTHREDVISFLKRSSQQFDLIVVDPPTFSNSKSTETVFDVQRDHADLLALVVTRLRPGGICWFSTNARKFKFSVPELAASCEFREITNQTLPPDFQGAKGGHRCWRIQAK